MATPLREASRGKGMDWGGWLHASSLSHLEVSVLPGEEGNAAVDGEAEEVGRHPGGLGWSVLGPSLAA